MPRAQPGAVEMGDPEQRIARDRRSARQQAPRLASARPADAHQVRRRRELAEAPLLAGAGKLRLGHGLVATRAERRPRRRLIVKKREIDQEGVRFGTLRAGHVARTLEHRQRHTRATRRRTACAPVSRLDAAALVVGAKPRPARELDARPFKLPKRGHQTRPRLHHELEWPRRRPLRLEERLVAAACPFRTRDELLALPSAERRDAAVGGDLPSDLHVRDGEAAAVMRADRRGEQVAVPLKEPHVKDWLAPRRCKGAGAAVSYDPVIAHAAVIGLGQLVLGRVHQPRASKHAVLEIEHRHCGRDEVVGAALSFGQVERAAGVALVKLVDANRQDEFAMWAEPGRRADQRWVELAQLA